MATFPANLGGPAGATFNVATSKGVFAATITVPPGIVPSSPVPPTVTVIDPAPGTPLARDGLVTLEIADDLAAFRRIALWVEYAGLGRDEMIFNGIDLRPPFTRRSTLIITSGVRRFVIGPDRGWPDAPVFRALAIDEDGNEVA
jgi:hypothetical protein